MSKFVERPRYLCSLGGVVGTLKALLRTIPILHSATGCGGNIANALNMAGGYLGSGYCAGQALPSSNVSEKDIVFGGEERLTEQIETTLELINGDLYFVVTGCMLEMIGDDINHTNNYMGYQGVFEVARRVARILKNTSYSKNISKFPKLPYNEEWYTQDPFKYIANS